MTNISLQDVEQALSKVMHPEINYSLVDLGMIRDVICKDNTVSITLKLPVLHVPVKGLLMQSIKDAVTELDAAVHVEIFEEEMNEEERTAFIKMAKEGWKF